MQVAVTRPAARFTAPLVTVSCLQRRRRKMANFHVLAGSDDRVDHPTIRKIGVGDLVTSLREGWDDFIQKPSHYVFLCLIYPIVGLVLAMWTSGYNALPLLYPLMSGFALI